MGYKPVQDSTYRPCSAKSKRCSVPMGFSTTPLHMKYAKHISRETDRSLASQEIRRILSPHHPPPYLCWPPKPMLPSARLCKQQGGHNK